MNYRSLPKGYRYAGNLDFMRNRRQMKIVVWLSMALLVVPALVGLALCPVGDAWRWMLRAWWRWPALAAALIAYIPLHELTHGIAMFALSGVRPKYGFRLPYAYAGSTAWFDRRSHVATALAPVVLWGVGIQIAIAALPAEWFWPLWAVQISNLSGSAGDLYTALAILRLEGDILIQDTGVRMRVYKKSLRAAQDDACAAQCHSERERGI